jgi:serine acetyltransferase
VILPGVTIGQGASVGAQSLVKRSLNEWGIYAGSPAKLLAPRAKDLLRLEQEYLSSIGPIEDGRMNGSDSLVPSTLE